MTITREQITLQNSIIRQREGGRKKNMKNLLKVSILNRINISLITLIEDPLINESNLSIAMYMFGRDWKKVEAHIGTRSGA